MFPSSPKLPLAAAALAVACTVAPAVSHADVLKDPQWQALADARRFVELEQAAFARISAKGDDADAWQAYTQGLLGQAGSGASARRDAGLANLQACVKATPKIAACHYGVGAVTGVQVMTLGMMKAAFGIGQVRDEFIKALEIDPALDPARSGLVQFYLMVPGLAGGSVSKARDVAQAAVARQPEYAKLLNAAIAQYDDRSVEAERLLGTVQVGGDASLAEELRGQWVALGFGYLEAKQPAKARAAFERVVKDKADLVEGQYGLARALCDQQQWDAAIAALQLAARLPGHDALPVDYRLGVAYQGKGDAAQAKAAYARYLASANPNPRNVDDARKRLADLG
ncbi:MAG: tetratricopeptide repeat protein [Betaproteobacteria bacterium]